MAFLPAYDVSKVPRGYGIIVVNTFENYEAYRRTGADKEVDNLKHLFQALGLIPVVYTELRKQQIQTLLENMSKQPDLAGHSMIAIAISSHGGEDGIFGTDIAENIEGPGGEKACAIEAKEIRGIFNSHYCPLLKDKPKLLFLNGNRGNKVEEVFSKADGDVKGIADDTDFLTVYSCAQGYASFMDEKKGGIFIDVLCETLLTYHGHNISVLIPVVNSSLMKRSSRIGEIDGLAVKLTQTCVAENNLTKSLSLPRVS